MQSTDFFANVEFTVNDKGCFLTLIVFFFFENQRNVEQIVLKLGSDREKNYGGNSVNFLCWKSNFFPRKKHRFTDVLKFLPKLYRENR